jgi:hypothetical protein
MRTGRCSRRTAAMRPRLRDHRPRRHRTPQGAGARGSYHGALPWCSPSVAGVTAEDRAHLLHFEYNDVRACRRPVEGRARISPRSW